MTWGCAKACLACRGIFTGWMCGEWACLGRSPVLTTLRTSRELKLPNGRVEEPWHGPGASLMRD